MSTAKSPQHQKPSPEFTETLRATGRFVAEQLLIGVAMAVTGRLIGKLGSSTGKVIRFPRSVG